MDLWDVPGMWGDLWGLSEGGRVRGFRGEFATVCAVVWGRWHACVGFGRCLEYWSVGFGVWWEGWVRERSGCGYHSSLMSSGGSS